VYGESFVEDVESPLPDSGLQIPAEMYGSRDLLFLG
jgi:hypothetical protein